MDIVGQFFYFEEEKQWIKEIISDFFNVIWWFEQSDTDLRSDEWEEWKYRVWGVFRKDEGECVNFIGGIHAI